ncbi:MAG: hypothetical protein QM530_10555 [Phycisphaerales bacterium]|nr:hypothetical protein [Phycisphaerales bacterium]
MDNKLNFTNYKVESTSVNATGTISSNYIANVFMWMFAALAVSTVFALLFASSPALMASITSVGKYGKLVPNGVGYLVMFAPLGFVMLMSFAFQRLSATALIGLFMAYAATASALVSFCLPTPLIR